MLELLWLLLPLAAASGWWAARRSAARSEPSAARYSPAYFRGLNYLLNEQPDKAIDIFVKMIEVDSETVETHLALGNLFRRRGEVDRAIRIHQNLIARPTLDRDQRALALLELGQDYMRAGLFDRAESLFKELTEMKLHERQAYSNLRTIYQQEKDWQGCLDVADRLERLTGDSLATEKAHYYCELAREACEARRFGAAEELLGMARSIDRHCVRATILRGHLAEQSGDDAAAVEIFQQVEEQDADYLPEVLPHLIPCFKRSGTRGELVDYLRRLVERRPGTAAILALAEIIEADEGSGAALEFVTRSLQGQPTLEGLDRLIALSLKQAGAESKETLKILQQVVATLIEGRAPYHCERCGFSSKTLYWQCPSCKSWSSIKQGQVLALPHDPPASPRVAERARRKEAR